MPTKEEITQWLKKTGRDRFWLAEKCLVSYKHLNNWFSKNGKIPDAKLVIIQKLMAETQAPPYEIEDKGNMSKLFITLDPESEDAILAECRRLNITLSAYCSLVVEWCATTPEGHAVIESLIKGTPLPSVIMNLDPLISGEKEDARKQFVPVEAFPSTISTSNQRYNLSVIGNIAAGGLQAGDTIPYHITANRPLGKDEYVLRVEGKSMEPTIKDGALVIMRKHTIPPTPKPGTIVEYYDERGVTLKKLARKKNPETGKMDYVLHPLNPEFGDIEPMDGGKISAIYVETLNQWEKA